MTNGEYFNSLTERGFHSDTMRPLNPLQRQWMRDYAEMLGALSIEEQEALEAAPIK